MDGGAKHDPWRFDARRLVETREADAALWIGPIEDPPDWLRRVPAVVLAGRGFAPDKMPEVAISVGRPGVDHPGVLYQLETRALCLVPPSWPTALPSSAEIVAAIHAACRPWSGGMILGGYLVDPVNHLDGPGDLWIEGGRIVAPPAGGRATETVDCTGCVVMAGAIDVHSHIGGGNVNTARLLLPEEHPASLRRPGETPLSRIGFDVDTTGRLYAEMGFTTVIEPAMMPSNGLHAHLELADIPIIDKGALVVLGNEDFLLTLLRGKESRSAVRDYVSYMVESTGALGIKVINAGASAAFKANARTFALDDEVPATA